MIRKILAITSAKDVFVVSARLHKSIDRKSRTPVERAMPRSLCLSAAEVVEHPRGISMEKFEDSLQEQMFPVFLRLFVSLAPPASPPSIAPSGPPGVLFPTRTQPRGLYVAFRALNVMLLMACCLMMFNGSASFNWPIMLGLLLVLVCGRKSTEKSRQQRHGRRYWFRFRFVASRDGLAHAWRSSKHYASLRQLFQPSTRPMTNATGHRSTYRSDISSSVPDVSVIVTGDSP